MTNSTSKIITELMIQDRTKFHVGLDLFFLVQNRKKIIFMSFIAKKKKNLLEVFARFSCLFPVGFMLSCAAVIKKKLKQYINNVRFKSNHMLPLINVCTTAFPWQRYHLRGVDT